MNTKRARQAQSQTYIFMYLKRTIRTSKPHAKGNSVKNKAFYVLS